MVSVLLPARHIDGKRRAMSSGGWNLPQQIATTRFRGHSLTSGSCCSGKAPDWGNVNLVVSQGLPPTLLDGPAAAVAQW